MMIIKLTEIYKKDNHSRSQSYELREIFVNPEHVVCMREDEKYKQLLSEDRLLNELDKRQSFTRIYLDRGQSGIDLTVVGAPTAVQEKLGLILNKQILRG